ncbi:hypothetical protein ACFLS4_05450 [Bacteroidota bacterium]
MRNLIKITLLLFTINVHAQSKFSEIEKFLGVVGYIHDTEILKEKVNGKEFEVWLKNGETAFPKTYSETGTCFFIYTHTDYYLVTAEHVARKTSLNSDIVISSENDNPILFKLGDIIEEKSSLNWTFHPNADVAVVLLDYNKITKELARCFLPFDMINYNLEAPFREREVTVYGYPLSLGVGRKISPITKTSKPSSGLIELPRFDNNKPSNFFLLDDPSVSGFSGGPVFELPQEITSDKKSILVKIYRIVGLVHGSISDKGGGFAAIVPSKYIKETIELAPGFSDTITFKYPNEKLWSERIYKNGDPWTVISNFDINGNPQEKGTLSNGTGTLYIYNKESKLEQIMYYKNGHLEKIEYKL